MAVSALQHTHCAVPALPPSVAPCPAPASPSLASPSQGDDLAFTASLFSSVGASEGSSTLSLQVTPGLQRPRTTIRVPVGCSSASGHWGPCSLSGRVPSGLVLRMESPLRTGPLRTGPLSGQVPSRTSPLSAQVSSQDWSSQDGSSQDKGPLRKGPLSGWVPSQDLPCSLSGRVLRV